MGKRGQNPLSQALYGFTSYMRGIRWLLRNKKYLFITFMPTLLGLLTLTFGWVYFFEHFDPILARIVFDKPDAWYMLAIYWVVYALAFVGVLGVSLVACLLLVNVIASPLYEMVSAAVEREITGKVQETGLWDSIRLIGEELKKVGFIVILSLLSFLLTTFLPFFSILAFLLTAFLLGWEFYDYPLARRGKGFRERLDAVLKDRWSVLAFGIWMLIPFIQFFLMPLAVAGGTIMCLEGLEESTEVNHKELK